MIDLEQLRQLVREVVREELAKAAHQGDLVAPAAFAKANGISTKTVRRMIADGRLPAKKIGRAVRIPATATIGTPAKTGGAKESDADYARRLLRAVGGDR